MERKTLERRILRLPDVEERVLAWELAQVVFAVEQVRFDPDPLRRMLVIPLLRRYYALAAESLAQERSRRFQRIKRELSKKLVATLKGEHGGHSVVP